MTRSPPRLARQFTSGITHCREQLWRADRRYAGGELVSHKQPRRLLELVDEECRARPGARSCRTSQSRLRAERHGQADAHSFEVDKSNAHVVDIARVVEW